MFNTLLCIYVRFKFTDGRYGIMVGYVKFAVCSKRVSMWNALKYIFTMLENYKMRSEEN